MSLSFSGKTVVITGSSRGIGLGIARRFAEAGASLHLIANEAAVHDRARELGASSADADIADRRGRRGGARADFAASTCSSTMPASS